MFHSGLQKIGIKISKTTDYALSSEKFVLSICKTLENKFSCLKELPKTIYLIGYIKGFCPQAPKLEPPPKTPHPQLWNEKGYPVYEQLTPGWDCTEISQIRELNT